MEAPAGAPAAAALVGAEVVVGTRLTVSSSISSCPRSGSVSAGAAGTAADTFFAAVFAAAIAAAAAFTAPARATATRLSPDARSMPSSSTVPGAGAAWADGLGGGGGGGGTAAVAPSRGVAAAEAPFDEPFFDEPFDDVPSASPCRLGDAAPGRADASVSGRGTVSRGVMVGGALFSLLIWFPRWFRGPGRSRPPRRTRRSRRWSVRCSCR